MKKFFNSRKNIITAAAAFALVLALTVSALICLKKPVIAFYGLDDSTVTAIKSAVDEWNKTSRVKYAWKKLDAAKTISENLAAGRRPELLITVSGAPVKNAVKKAAKNTGLSAQTLSDLTTTIRSTALTDENTKAVQALPLLSSHFEIDIDTQAFKRSKTGALNSWKDFEAFLKYEKKFTDSPLVFGGKNPELFLDLLGALTEAFDSAEEYSKAVSLINSSNLTGWNEITLASELCDDYTSPLYSSVTFLADWLKKGYINKESFNLTDFDANEFLKAKLASASFMTLEQHRRADGKTIERFSSVYFPSDKNSSKRNFTAKVIYAVPLRKNKAVSKAAEWMISTQGQENLSRATGLAPVLAKCRTPDHQSDDARFWVAATETPLAGLSREVDLTLSQKKDLAKAISLKIKDIAAR